MPSLLVTVAVAGAAVLLLLYGLGMLGYLIVARRFSEVGPLADGAVVVPARRCRRQPGQVTRRSDEHCTA